MKIKEIIKLSDKENNLLKSTSLVFVGVVIPWLIIPIVKIVGYSEVIEEVLKASVVLFVLNVFTSLAGRIKNIMLFILSFGLSESLFYLSYASQIDNMSIFWQRIILTIPMHIITVLILLFSALKNKKTIILGIIASLAIHLTFNAFVSITL